MPKSRNILPPKRWWTPEEEAYMREHYADTLTVDIARHFGCPEKRVLAKANAMGLYKSREFIAAIASERSSRPDHGGRKTAFKPGNLSWNKGTHFVAGGRSAETRFKPGMKPHTWVPVGSYRIVMNKNGGPVLERKVNDLPGANHVRWKGVHRLVWEAEHGPTPPGCIVVFKPGRKSTELERITLDAVECISRLELMQRNTIHNYPPEFADLARLKGQLVRVINRKTKEAA